VVLDPLDTGSNTIALLAQNHFQVIEGGIAAGYFNAPAERLLDLYVDAAVQTLGPFAVDNPASMLPGCR